MRILPCLQIPVPVAPSSIAQYWFLAPIFMVGFIVADDLLTYYNIRDLAARFSLPFAAALETNDTVRNSWLKYGMPRGELRALLLFLLPTLLILALATAAWTEFPLVFGLMAGIYLFIDARHVNMRRHLGEYHLCPTCHVIHRPSPFLPEEKHA